MNKKYDEHKSSILGLEANVVSLLIYLVPFLIGVFSYGGIWGNFTWIIPLLALIFEKDSKLVKFHAWQALLMTLFYGALGVITTVVGTTVSITSIIAGSAGGVVSGMGIILVVGVISIIIAILEIIAAVKAYGWVSYRLPIIGKWSSNLAHENE
ncbi:DUF4870 domain-containing protein [Anaerorhabdus furcosa]|uniref:Uncharacterized membrane protein n=1 Tax=Anaerorhabdus furcosa TaxID=118967 RepID=A0A1T4P274_9FIRM|nr:DUF4870 domain-containing protein [Anaerorhabdus furcosa]SJZ85634.1 Uncharacterized membrane protein [Anaerorhabdus furcosa]